MVRLRQQTTPPRLAQGAGLLGVAMYRRRIRCLDCGGTGRTRRWQDTLDEDVETIRCPMCLGTGAVWATLTEATLKAREAEFRRHEARTGEKAEATAAEIERWLTQEAIQEAMEEERASSEIEEAERASIESREKEGGGKEREREREREAREAREREREREKAREAKEAREKEGGRGRGRGRGKPRRPGRRKGRGKPRRRLSGTSGRQGEPTARS